MTPTEKVLRKARALLVRDGWTRGTTPGRRCAGLALYDAGHYTCPHSAELLRRAIGIGRFDSIPLWNDHPKRTKRQVLDAFTRAARLASEEGR